MVAKRHPHPVAVTAPFYRTDAETALHRYLESDFVALFNRDLRTKVLTDPATRAWEREDCFGEFRDHTVLRRPTHRTFYVAACEVSCAADELGAPALDPAKIASAGFVIRRLDGKGESGWMTLDGIPRGWRPVTEPHADPDLDRRLRRIGVRPPEEGTFNVEESYPLHPVVTRDADGRPHTVLFGYLPLGGAGAAAAIDDGSPFDADEEKKLSRELPWPFGGPEGDWRDREDALAIDGGRPNAATAAMLELLISRYHLGEIDDGDNTLLARICDTLRPFGEPPTQGLDERALRRHAERHPVKNGDGPPLTLLDYLRDHYGELVRWIEQLREEEQIPPLPKAPWSLLVSEEQAALLRGALAGRLLTGLRQMVASMPIPRFQQGREDRYVVRPFVRTLNERGCERIQWGPPSLTFRVAGPLDPEASRPAFIPMPSLKELSRGLARGAAFALPADLADRLGALTGKKAAKKALDGEIPSGGNPLGLGWICSFSLPVITLVAMIVLMTFVIILNIAFWWLPWVKSCFPMPSFSKRGGNHG